MTSALRRCAVAVVGPSGIRVRCASGATLRVVGSSARPSDPARWCRDVLGARAARVLRDGAHAVALLAAHAVLERAAAEGLTTTETEGGFLVANAWRGSRDADALYWKSAVAHDGAFASPQLFASTLPSAMGGEIAIAFGLRGPAIAFAGRSPVARGMAMSIAAEPPTGVVFVLLVEVGGPVGESSARRWARASVWTPNGGRPWPAGVAPGAGEEQSSRAG